MSGFIAIIDLRRNPVDPELMGRCEAASAHRGIPQRRDPQPWVSFSALGDHARSAVNERFAVIIHGRAQFLSSPDTEASTEALLSLCETGGLRALDDLDGEVAWVAIDLRSGEVRFARDRSGVKPLMMRRSGNLLGLASEPAPLLRIGRTPEPNEGMIAEYLSGAPQNRSETVWVGIDRLAPLSVGSVDPNGHVSTSAERSIDLSTPVRSETEWLELLRTTMTEAVVNRLDPAGVTAIELSGGFDSTTNLALAATSGNPYLLLAVVRDYSGTTTEETAYWRAALDRFPVEVLITPAQESHSGWMIDDARRFGDRPVVPHLGAWRTELAAITAAGVRVSVSGQGGDERLGHSYKLPQQLLARGRVRAALTALRHHAGVTDRRSAARRLVMAGVASVAGSRSPTVANRTWLSTDLAHRVDLQARIIGPEQGGGTPVQSELVAWATGEIPHQYLEAAERTAASHGVELRHPFFDWNIVELCCQMPEPIRTRPDDPRAAHRRTFADVLPALVTERRDKADFTEPYRAAVIDEGLFDDPLDAALVRHGWIDGSWLVGAVERTRAGQLGSAALLTIAASVEAWARAWVD